MRKRQRESTVQYLYGLPQEVGLLAIVSPWVTSQESRITIVPGFAGTVLLFLWAYWLEGSNDTL